MNRALLLPSMMSVENRRPFATTTTFHGVPYVSATKNRCGQAFWIAALAVAFAVAIFSVVQAVSEYIKAPMAVTIRTVPAALIELPDLVICPTRGLNALKMLKENMSYQLIDNIMQEFAVDMDWLPLRKNSSNISYVQIQETLKEWMSAHNFSDFRKLAMHYSYTADEIIHDISAAGGGAARVELNSSRFQLTIGYQRGVCFSYLSSSSINWPGMDSGFNLILKQPNSKYLENSFTDGWKIGVAKPLLAAPASYVRILPNAVVDVEISRTDVRRLPGFFWPKPGILCKDSLSYKTSEGCAGYAYGKAVKAACNCSLTSAPKDPTVDETKDRACSPSEVKICYATNGGELSRFINLFQSNCLPVCNETLFSTSVSVGNLNQDAVLSSLGLTNSTDVSIVRLSYGKMEYTLMESFESITLNTVVSNVGGQLGLWIGASMISLVHLISYIPSWAKILISQASRLPRLKRKQKSSPASSQTCAIFVSG